MGKFWKSIRAQFNKIANWFWTQDPIAQMQYEYDKAVEELKGGRSGLEEYRGLVERVQRQVNSNNKTITMLTAKIKGYLKVGDRKTAGQLAVQLQRAKKELTENEAQLAMHEKSYNNNVEKVRHASKKLADVRFKIKKYEADLKMSNAEAELARLSQSFDFDITTDFGELEQVIQDKIDLNRGKVRVAADLSEQGMDEIAAEKAMEESLADDLLSEFEVDMGLKTAETADIESAAKSLGPDLEESAEELLPEEPEKVTDSN